MPYIVNHIHIKSKDPEKTAKWFVGAFNVKIVSVLITHSNQNNLFGELKLNKNFKAA